MSEITIQGLVPAVSKLRRLFAEGMKQRLLAEKLAVSQATVSRWASGESVPAPEHRQAIEDLSRTSGKLVITFDDWYTLEQLRLAYRFSRKRIARLRERKEQGDE
jgi:transcriptional regulator with XRE-family HTH domain